MSLGDKLSSLRKQNNYTQEQLADILGVSRQAISKWESDVAYPETDKLIRLSALYNCSIDYLLRDDLDTQDTNLQPYPTQQGLDVSNKAHKLFGEILRFAPTVLYSLWALLLWAFYAAPLLKQSDKNLYQWFGNDVVVELQPVIIALLVLGAICCAYIVALGVLQRYAVKKVNTIGNIVGFVLQVAVFVCTMSLYGVCNWSRLQAGEVVVIVATFTGVFVLLQAVFIALDYYFFRDEATKDNVTFARGHKIGVTIVASVLVVAVAVAAVVPNVLQNTDDGIAKASSLYYIDPIHDRAIVVNKLGKPMDVDTEKLVKIIGGSYSVNTDMYFYCSPTTEKFIRRILRVYDKLERTNLPSNADDVQVLNAQLNKLLTDFNDFEFQYIKVFFEEGLVYCVEYDSNFSGKRRNDVKWDYRENENQKIELYPYKNHYGETPYESEYYVRIYYADGSYRLSKIENLSAVGNADDGWTVEWNDHWGSYTMTTTR